jgi:class 3 adenylate cyclase
MRFCLGCGQPVLSVAVASRPEPRTYTPKHLAEKILTSRSALEGERKQQRACYAALHLRDALRRYADELRIGKGISFAVRMGLNSGEVVVGKIGDDLRMDYTAQGHTVGLAARMEQIVAADSIYISEHTAKLVSGYCQLRDLGETRVKGLNDLLHVLELEGVGRVRTRLDVSRTRGFSKFSAARAR